MSSSVSQISTWGNSLAIRITKPMAKAARFTDGTPVRVIIKPGRIVIESKTEPTMKQMLSAFNPKKHGGEAFAATDSW
jgi:antitoxin MazE